MWCSHDGSIIISRTAVQLRSSSFRRLKQNLTQNIFFVSIHCNISRWKQHGEIIQYIRRRSCSFLYIGRTVMTEISISTTNHEQDRVIIFNRIFYVKHIPKRVCFAIEHPNESLYGGGRSLTMLYGELTLNYSLRSY